VSSDRPLSPVPISCVASLNTHDTPTFAAYWRDLNSEMKSALLTVLKNRGLLEGSDDRSVLRACLAYLAGSRTQTVLVNLEDLWLETEPQNVPGTTDEHPNWRRKARYAFEEFSRMPEVTDVLQEVDRLRRRLNDAGSR
jgi:4-alpha-glucanotransferase